MCSLCNVAAEERVSRRIVASVVMLLAAASGLGACGRSDPAGSSVSTTSSRPSTPTGSTPTGSTGATGSTPAPPLSAPQDSFAQDGQYFTDVTEADPALVTYEQQQGNVALRALLTDGSAFCALLQRGGGIDEALVSEAVGARSEESQTHLPLSVTTFNAIEAVALLTLCPSEQKLLPAAQRSKIRDLGDSLAARSG